MELLESLAMQTMLYMAFVLIFQMLANSLRDPQEYHVDIRLMEDFVLENFDSSHNTFESIRRFADVYEWGNQVLWPSLFANIEPCNPASVGSRATPKTCNDLTWPDGEGAFGSQGASSFNVSELVRQMDILDWTEGVFIRQMRAAPVQCHSASQLERQSAEELIAAGFLQPLTDAQGNEVVPLFTGANAAIEYATEVKACYPELEPGGSSNVSFGYNGTHPTLPMWEPWEHFSASELGGNPEPGSVRSAAIPSMAQYDASGYVALAIPFFSDTWIEEERGPAENVTDFRRYAVSTTNGKVPRYFCIRTSHNGRSVRQLCDPTDDPRNKNGRLTGVVRRAAEEMWNDLKRGHFLDARSRFMSVTLQLKSNHLGIRTRLSLMLELTSVGAILPSYDVETRVLSEQKVTEMGLYANLSLVLVVFFALIELLEIQKSGTEGVRDYLQNLWNWMDWINYAIFLQVYLQVVSVQSLIGRGADPSEPLCAASYLCRHVGYFDDWRLMGEYRLLKQFLSLCLSVQLFKIIKFTSELIPKMGHMTEVLRVCLVDMIFFSGVFAISIISFSAMLCLQVGSVISPYIDQFASFITLARALFFDFDMREILENSSGYWNALLFLLYLFVAVFVMLSLFLAILAEGHSKVRDEEEKRKQEDGYNEYGVVASVGKLIQAASESVVTSWMGEPEDDPDADSEDEHRPELSARGKSARGKDGDGKDDVDDETFSERIVKALQDGSGDQTAEELLTEVRQMGAAVAELAAAVHALKASRPTTVRPAAVRRPDRSHQAGSAAAAANEAGAVEQPPPPPPPSDHHHHEQPPPPPPPLGPPPHPPQYNNPLLAAADPLLAMDGRQKRASTPPAPPPARPAAAGSVAALLEAMDARLSKKLTRIDEKLEQRERKRAAMRAELNAATGSGAIKATPGRQLRDSALPGLV